MQNNDLENFSNEFKSLGRPACPMAAYGWLAFQAPRGDGSFMTSTRAPGRVLGWSEARARRFLLSLTEHGP